MAAPAGSGSGRGEDEQPASGRGVSRHYRYVPREREEYAARRALFLQSYRLSTRGDDEEEEAMAMGLRGRVARRLRDAGVAGRAAAARAASQARGAARWWVGAGLGRAWRGWRTPLLLRRAHGGVHRPSSLLGHAFGCFGGARRPSREYHFLQGFA